MDNVILERALASARRLFPDASPACGLILGSGLSDVVSGWDARGSASYDQIEGLGSAGVEGHRGELAWCELDGMEIFAFRGRRHRYEGQGWEPPAIPVHILRQFGARLVVITNAAGSLRDTLCPGTIMIIDDHINLMDGNPLIGSHNPLWGKRFPDQSCVYDGNLRAALSAAATDAELNVVNGVYAGVCGPVFETPAEARFLKTIGADAVGMSTVPEAILANAAGMRVAGLSCITNRSGSQAAETHEQVLQTVSAMVPKVDKLLRSFFRRVGEAG